MSDGKNIDAIILDINGRSDVQEDQSQSPVSYYIGIMLAGLGAVAFSLRAIFVKLAYQDMSDPITLLALRMIFSLPFFLIAIIVLNRTALDQKPITRKDAMQLIALGFFGYYLSSFLDMLGLQYVAAGVGRLLLFTYPTMVVIITAYFLGRFISRRELAALLTTYVGVALVLSGQLANVSSHFWLGAILVTFSAVSFSIYLVGSGEVVRRVGSIRFTAYATTCACLFCILQFLALRPLGALEQSPRVYLLAGAMAILSTVMPVFMMAEALRRIGASRVAMISALGPVSTIVTGYLGLGEEMNLIQTVGGILVVSGVLIISVKSSSSKRH